MLPRHSVWPCMQLMESELRSMLWGELLESCLQSRSWGKSGEERVGSWGGGGIGIREVHRMIWSA